MNCGPAGLLSRSQRCNRTDSSLVARAWLKGVREFGGQSLRLHLNSCGPIQRQSRAEKTSQTVAKPTGYAGFASTPAALAGRPSRILEPKPNHPARETTKILMPRWNDKEAKLLKNIEVRWASFSRMSHKCLILVPSARSWARVPTGKARHGRRTTRPGCKSVAGIPVSN